MPVSSDSALRAHLRKELGLNDSSRVPDDDLNAEITDAKRELSKAIAYRVETGDSFEFYGDQMAETLTNYMKVRISPLSSKKGGPPQDRIPADHPASVSEIRHTDFGSSGVNFWRDRMIHYFNRI